MLKDYVRDSHRAEYNSIKHGLRASHGAFSIALAPEGTPGMVPPPEAMQVIGSSQDASFFNVPSSLENATNQQSKINFSLEQVSVTWALEKVLMEIKILLRSTFLTATANIQRKVAQVTERKPQKAQAENVKPVGRPGVRLP